MQHSNKESSNNHNNAEDNAGDIQTLHQALLHLHLGLCRLILGDGEVQSDVDDGGEVEEEEGGHQQQGLSDH